MSTKSYFTDLNYPGWQLPQILLSKPKSISDLQKVDSRKPDVPIYYKPQKPSNLWCLLHKFLTWLTVYNYFNNNTDLVTTLINKQGNLLTIVWDCCYTNF